MTDQHYDESVMIELLLGDIDPSSKQELEDHIHDCPNCQEELESLRVFIEELEDPSTWKPEDPRLPKRSSEEWVMSELAALTDRLRKEERDAELRLADTDGDWTSAPRSAGAVRVLLARARELFDRSPAEALAISRHAKLLSDSISSGDSFFDAELRASARREEANALRLLGRFPEALRMLEEAEFMIASYPGAGFQRACIHYVRATVLFQLERRDDALASAEKASTEFLVYGDDRRLAHTNILIGGIYFDRNQPSVALDLFVEQIKPLQKLGDQKNLAHLFNNIAHCHVVLGDRASAATFFHQSLQLLDILNIEGTKGTVQWGLGRLCLADNKIDEAIDRLSVAEKIFKRLSMSSQAALVGLETVEVQLGRGETIGIAARCRELIELFRRAGLPANADAALAYLQEAVQSERVNVSTLRHVRIFLEELPAQPQLLFVPPPEAIF